MSSATSKGGVEFGEVVCLGSDVTSDPPSPLPISIWFCGISGFRSFIVQRKWNEFVCVEFARRLYFVSWMAFLVIQKGFQSVCSISCSFWTV